MSVIDPSVTWRPIEERLAVETDPSLRHNLEVVLAHMLAEARLDLDGLMATLHPDPHYHFFNGPARGELHGYAEVRAFYEAFAAAGTGKLQLATDRLVVDRSCVITEGVMRMAFPARTLALRGIVVDDAEAEYLFEDRTITIWPFDDDGVLIGEDAYFAGAGFRGITERRIDPADIAAYAPPG